MFGAIRSVFVWIFQAIITTVVVDWVANFLRRRREHAEAANTSLVTIEKPADKQLPQP